MNLTIWQNFRFTRFFAATTISNFGDWLDIFALQIIFVHEFHASPIVMGMLAFLYFIPAILLGPIAGAFADRYSKRNIMIIADIISAGLTIGLVLSANIAIVLLFILIRSSIASLNSPTQQAYVKQVVADQHLLQASSFTTISFQLAKILGPILGAVILLFTSARVCLGINAASFLLSFAILLTLPADVLKQLHKLQHNISAWFVDVKNGAGFVWKHFLFRVAISLTAVWFFGSMIYNSQLAILLQHILPQEPHILGYVIGIEALGAVLAGLLLSRYRDITNYLRYFALAFFLISIGNLGIACYQAEWPKFILFTAPFIRGIGGGIAGVTYSYLIRKQSPENQIGCIYGISSAVQNLALAIGTLLSGILILVFGMREVYFGLSAMMLILAAAASFSLRMK
jgi:MFS family permease